MSLKKSITNPIVIFSVLLGLFILALFIYWLSPGQESNILREQSGNAANEEAIKEQGAAYDEMMKRFTKAKNKENRNEAVEGQDKSIHEKSTKDVNEATQKERLDVVYEDDFSKDVVLPNGRVTPILKSNILGDSNEIEARFKFEKRNEQWAGNWENTLNNIVGSAGAQFDMGGYDVTCKSKTCKIGVKLSEDNPYGYDQAFRAMNKEFVLNDMQVVPGPIKEEGTEYIIYYYFPDDKR